jgi:hypothetical protein
MMMVISIVGIISINHNEEDDISKGAGLGLLTMARDSKSKIEYRFENVVGFEDRYAELHLKTQF